MPYCTIEIFYSLSSLYSNVLQSIKISVELLVVPTKHLWILSILLHLKTQKFLM